MQSYSEFVFIVAIYFLDEDFYNPTFIRYLFMPSSEQKVKKKFFLSCAENKRSNNHNNNVIT